MTVDVNDPVVGFRTDWMDTPPRRCARGHWLLAGHMIVYTTPCSCGDHITWECECSAITYGPTLATGCSLLDEPSGSRR